MNLKKLSKYIGLVMIISYVYNLLDMFYIAYFHNYKVLMTINDFGEAKFEFWLLLLTLPFVVYLLYDTLKSI